MWIANEGWASPLHAEICPLVRQYIQNARWLGNTSIVARAIVFTIQDCGNDTWFVGARVNEVKPGDVPWKFRERCLAAWKLRRDAPRPAARKAGFVPDKKPEVAKLGETPEWDAMMRKMNIPLQGEKK